MNSVDGVQDAFAAIDEDWPELLDSQCNALQLALRLLDSSSVGDAHKYPKFLALKQEFSDSLKKAVNAHYMAFNDSIGVYEIAVDSIAESQSTLGKVKEDLQGVQDMASSRASLLGELCDKQRQYGETIEVFRRIEEVREDSVKIDAAISAKDFDTAEELVLKTSQVAAKHGLWQLPALAALQHTCQAQGQTLFDSLLDEISELVYVKGVPSPEAELRISTEDMAKVLQQPFDTFLDELEKDEGVSPDIDTSTFHSLKKCLGLLAGLDRLKEGLQLVVDRCGSELRRLTRRTAEETKGRFPEHSDYNTGTSSTETASRDDVLGLESLQSVNSPIVQDFFTTLFKRCISVLQLHRSVLNILPDEHYDFLSVWKQLQAHLGSVIYTYIVDESLLESLELQQDNYEDESSFSRRPKGYTTGDGAPIIQFAQFTLLGQNGGQLHRVLTEMFADQSAAAAASGDGSLFIEDDDNTGLTNVKRTVLVRPNIFNMSAIVDPFLLFVGSAALFFPEEDKSSSPILFFTHFMDYVFRTQLENTLLYRFDRLQRSTDAASLHQFFSGAMSVLDTSLHYREPYAGIILKLLDKMTSRFQGAVNEVIPPEFLRKARVRLIASWFNDGELLKVSEKVMRDPETDVVPEKVQAHAQKELQLTLKNGADTLSLINEHDFLDPNRFDTLSKILEALLDTLKWLPVVKRDVQPPDSDPYSLPYLKETWHILDSDAAGMHKQTQVDGYASSGSSGYASHPYLALSGKFGERFDTTVDALQRMALRIKLYMRYDLRIKAIWCVCQIYARDAAWWNPDYETEEIDGGVLRFNHNTMESHRLLQQVIAESPQQRVGIFTRLPDLLDRLFVSEATRVGSINSNGVHRVFVNVRVLLQMLRNVLDPKEVDFSRSLGYFELFAAGEDGIYDRIVETSKASPGRYSLDEYKKMVHLVFSESLEAERGTKEGKAGRAYAETVKRLEKEMK